MDFRSISLSIAESVDAWRIIPRTILVLYSTLVFNLYIWYKSIPTYVQSQCDPGTLRVLMDAGMLIEDAKSIACSVVDIVGGPTAAQSAFVTTIIGLSAGIFGLYVATGRKWDKSFHFNDRYNPFPYPGTNYHSNSDYYNSNSPYGPNRRYGPSWYGDNNRHYGPRGPWGSQEGGDDSKGEDDFT